MITAKHDPTRATSLMEDLKEFRKEASNGESSIQIEDLGEVLKLKDHTNLEEDHKTN